MVLNILSKHYFRWFLIGTIFLVLFLLSFYFLSIINSNVSYIFPYDLRLMILILFGGILGEIIEKSHDIIKSIISWFLIGLYQSLLFFIIFWVIYQIIINNMLEGHHSISPSLLLANQFVWGSTFFISFNFIGGLIIFFIKPFFKKYYSHK